MAFDAYRQAELYVELRSRVPGLRATGFGGWALSPDACLEIVDLVHARRPRLAVDLGSGLSSVLLGCLLRDDDLDGRVVSIDHDERFASRTRALLSDHGLTNVDLRCSPLIPFGSRESDPLWYDPRLLEDLHDIDLLVIDGPPARTSVDARGPSLPALRDRLADDAVVVLDDAARPSERRLAGRWASALGGTIEFRRAADKGIAVVTRAQPPAGS